MNPKNQEWTRTKWMRKRKRNIWYNSPDAWIEITTGNWWKPGTVEKQNSEESFNYCKNVVGKDLKMRKTKFTKKNLTRLYYDKHFIKGVEKRFKGSLARQSQGIMSRFSKLLWLFDTTPRNMDSGKTSARRKKNKNHIYQGYRTITFQSFCWYLPNLTVLALIVFLREMKISTA